MNKKSPFDIFKYQQEQKLLEVKRKFKQQKIICPFTGNSKLFWDIKNYLSNRSLTAHAYQPICDGMRRL